MARFWACGRLSAVLVLVFATSFSGVQAAPYAAMVMDARNGKVLHARNADTRLHPASLTKMMTLYIAFEAVRRGELTLDTRIRISNHAAGEPASKLWLKAGSRVKLRYLIRAAAVKSANDAATAIAEGISGSEDAFARRMNRTARALGMKNTNFKNAHGLTQKGHYSTARDMTILGRHIIYDYPEYYNLFSRRTTNANGTEVANTNRRLLNAYRGADGIKTGYTRAAGFNLVASAERGQERIIATMFGGTSGAARNARVAELLDMGFARAPSRVAIRKPRPPRYGDLPPAMAMQSGEISVASSAIPVPRPGGTQFAQAAPTESASAGAPATQQIAGASTSGVLSEPAAAPVQPSIPRDVIDAQIAAALAGTDSTAQDAPQAEAVAVARRQTQMQVPAWPVPMQRPAKVVYSSSAGDGTLAVASVAPPAPRPEPELIPRGSSSGGSAWSIRVGTYPSRYEAERVLLKTALIEIETLNAALREVTAGSSGYEARFIGLSERSAALACQRLTARAHDCTPLAP